MINLNQELILMNIFQHRIILLIDLYMDLLFKLNDQVILCIPLSLMSPS